jgi:hypothetical protein
VIAKYRDRGREPNECSSLGYFGHLRAKKFDLGIASR